MKSGAPSAIAEPEDESVNISNHTLRFQSIVYLFIVCSVFAGLCGLALAMHPVIPVSERLYLSVTSSVIILLGVVAFKLNR